MKSIIVLLTVIIYSSGFSQLPVISWQNCYGTSENDHVFAIDSTENGYLLAIEIRTDGPGISNYHGSYDIWLIRIDFLGNIFWEKCYGGSSAESPIKLIKKNNNEFLIFGYSGSIDGDVQSGNNGYSDLWVVKINSTGDIIWENTYGCTGYDVPRDMILTPDGGFVMIDRIGIGGGDVTNFYGSGDVWMCKCDSLGNIEWEKTLGNQWLDSGMSMIINSEGNIVMIGAAAHYGGLVDCTADDGYGDVWLIEMNMAGNILWQRCYGGSYYELGYKIEEHDNGYIFIASSCSNDGDVTGHHGPAGNPPDGWPDYWIVKINNAGDIVWQKSYGGYDVDEPIYISKILGGSIIAFGVTYSNDGDVNGNHSMPGGYDSDLWTLKLSMEGEIEWQQCYGGWGSERLETPHTILKKGDYNYVIGSSTNFKSGNDDIQCDIHAEYDYDAWIFEIDSLDTTGAIENYYDQDLVNVYPNPAGEYAEFQVQGFRFQFGCEVRVANLFGQLVAKLPIKSEKTVWDCRKVKAGVYFYFVEIDRKRYSGKIVINKTGL